MGYLISRLQRRRSNRSPVPGGVGLVSDDSVGPNHVGLPAGLWSNGLLSLLN
jgi:hypothetical protein